MQSRITHQQVKILHYALLAVFSVPLFFIGVNNTHSWGDDYAQYIIEARNIAEGKPFYQSGYVYNPLNPEYAPPSYPPGFPLMLAPLVKFYGIAIQPMLCMMAVLLSALLFILYHYYCRYLHSTTALSLAVVSVYCAGVMDMKVHVLSDIPSLLFVSLYLLLRGSARLPWDRLALIILVSVFAVMIRTQNILLIMAEGLVLTGSILSAILNRSFSLRAFGAHPSLIIIAGFLLVYLPVMALAFPSPGGSFSFYLNFIHLYNGNFTGYLAFNFNYLIDLLKSMFHFSSQDKFTTGILSLFSYGSLVFVITGFLISLRKERRTEDYFFLLMCAIILILPVHQGLRYLLPVLPVFMLYLCNTARLILPALTGKKGKWPALFLSGLYLLISVEHYRELSAPLNWTPHTSQDSAAFAYLSNKVKEHEIVAFSKPRALSLYAGINATPVAWQATPQENKKMFDSLGVKYLLRRLDVEEDQVERYLKGEPVEFIPEKIAGVYTLYRLR